MLEKLVLSNFRCFESYEQHFSAGINLFTGENGVGKTSLIEAVYLAGRGKSFRTPQLTDLIRAPASSALVFVQLVNEGQVVKIGQEIERSRIHGRINGTSMKKRSELLDYLPIQIITPESHELLDSGPGNRRKYLDWGLFHVEHAYRQSWSKFNRVMKQRNQALKTKSNLDPWNEAFVENALSLSDYRQQYLLELEPYFNQTQNELIPDETARLEYYPGWKKESALIDQLRDSSDRDSKTGWTSVGPQKADIRFEFKLGKRNLLSRGQQKLLVFALQIAQCRHLRDHLSISPILLIDDLSSELDFKNTLTLFDSLRNNQMQTLVSMIDATNFVDHVEKVFHVEHSE